MKKTSQKERYLIINPGRPGIRKVKKVARKKRNPGTDFAGSWTFEGEPHLSDPLTSRAKFIKDKLQYSSEQLSPRARRQISELLNQIGDILTKELL